MSTQILSTEEIKTIYSKWAKNYDASLWLFSMMGFRIKTYRRRAIRNLQLSRGDIVVDLGCGTGLNFKILQNYVGSDGKIIGVDLSPEMLDQARKRAGNNDWKNIELIQSDMGNYQIPKDTNGILSTLAITMSADYDEIIKNMANILSEGKRMSIFELQRPQNWPRWLVKTMVLLLKSYGTRYEHTQRKPCKSIQKYFRKFESKTYYFGSVCVATGTV